MNEALKARIQANTFVNKVRSEMKVDEAQYAELCAALQALAQAWRGTALVDKELALELYTAPQMIRNAFLSFSEHPSPLPDVAGRLEEMWIELDALVLDCLS